MPEPQRIHEDSRGILDPWLLRQRVRLIRYPVGPELAGLVDRFWAVAWDLPDATVHRQQVLTHPAANLSVGHGEGNLAEGAVWPIEARLHGVARRLSTRVLVGRGWTVAAMTTPGGLGAFVTEPATAFNDRVVALQEAMGIDDAALIGQISAQPDQASRIGVLTGALARVVARADPQRVRVAREVANLARLAANDRSLRRLSDLCAVAGVGPRSLQRMFLEYAGVSPTWVLRRYRLLEAAEVAHAGRRVPWAQVAAELGYADQAHLVRDFRGAIGQTPRRTQRRSQVEHRREREMTDEPAMSRPIGWWLKEADRRLDAAFDRALAGRGVDRRAWQVLASLARGPASRSELVRSLASFDTAAKVDSVVDDLSARGWVEEEADQVRLTQHGVREHVDLAALVDQVRAQVSVALPPDEYVALVRLLERLVAGLPPRV